MKQTFRARHCQQRTDFAAAARLSEDHYVAGIAAEVRDVVMRPFERRDQIQIADVGRARIFRAADFRQIQIAQNSKAVIDRNDDDIAATAQVLAVVGRQFLSRTGLKTAAVQPDHHRAFLAIVNARRPDVRAQTVLAWNPVVPTEEPGLFIVRPTGAGYLRTDLTVLHRASHARPGPGFGRRHESRFAADWRGVRHPFESENAVADVTADFARRGFNDGIGFKLFG